MTKKNGVSLVAGVLLVTALGLLSSCNETSTTAQAAGNAPEPSTLVRAGTRIDVALGSKISSETAGVGSAWHGTVTENVMTQNGQIPAGSEVTGVVTGVLPAKRGSRAMLDLGIRSIHVKGNDESIVATSESVIAGSPRARNLGAIAGGVAAGALIGKAVGDGKNATVGGIIGGAAAAGVVAGSKGYQVVLPSGTVMSFTVSETVAMR